MHACSAPERIRGVESSVTKLSERAFGAVPPPALVLVLLGIVSVQLGSTLVSSVGSFGTVALRLSFAATLLRLIWRPSQFHP